jgi:hypothetical protein
MSENTKTQSRKKFLGLSLAASAVVAGFRFFKPAPKQPKGPTTVKLLSQDGTLVEVDTRQVLCMKRDKISDDVLKKWVHK